MKYIINLMVVFNPSDNSLCLQNNPSLVVKIPPPATRLLQELINNRGVIITRDELLKNVWEEYGFTGSNNNLSHYISHLRKALLSLNSELSIITTVPKVGFRLDARIDVVLLSDADNPFIVSEGINGNKGSEENSEGTEENNEGTEYPETTEDSEKAETNDANEDPKAIGDIDDKPIKKKYHHKISIGFLIVTAAFIILSLIIYQKKMEIKNNFKTEPSSYLYQEGKCHIYFLEDKNIYSNNEIYSFAKSDIPKEKINCNEGEKRIFYKKTWSKSKIDKATFIGVCYIKDNGNTHCITVREN